MSPGKWIAGLLCCVSLAAAAQRKDLVSYANTLQGTNSEFALSHGNTHPSTALPFGMHAWSAQTGKNGDGWKYQYKATSIRGFQQVHQCSPWTGDYAVFSLMPVAGELKVNENERAAEFSHDDEITRLKSVFHILFAAARVSSSFAWPPNSCCSVSSACPVLI